ncbi:uncharacterized protein LOC144161514 [Haemaphysalis longicornis]
MRCKNPATTSCHPGFPLSSLSGPFSVCNYLDLTNPAVLVSLIAACECRSRVLGWHVRRRVTPVEVRVVTGWIPPSEGHGRRITKTLRSECWNQKRHFKDCLRVACARNSSGEKSYKVFREGSAHADCITEALWNYVRPFLPRKEKKLAAEGKLLILGDTPVQERHQNVLKVRPKCCVEPSLSAVEQLALTRDIARCVPEKERERCVVECVDAVCNLKKSHRVKPKVRDVACHLSANGLRVIQSDKEGHFVVLPEDMFQAKALLALDKCFKEVKESTCYQSGTKEVHSKKAQSNSMEYRQREQ